MQAEQCVPVASASDRLNGDERILQCCLQYQLRLQVHRCNSGRPVSWSSALVPLRYRFALKHDGRGPDRKYEVSVQNQGLRPNHMDTVVLLTNDGLLQARARAAGVPAFASDAFSPRCPLARGVWTWCPALPAGRGAEHVARSSVGPHSAAMLRGISAHHESVLGLL